MKPFTFNKNVGKASHINRNNNFKKKRLGLLIFKN